VNQSTMLTDDDVRRCRMISDGEIGIIRQIASAVADATDVPFKAIMGVRRDPRTVQARQLVMYIARRQGLSLQRIGYAMCRDHTTILHGIRAEEKRRGER
jgi:chromosomal replication initiation ATPase DnaA